MERIFSKSDFSFPSPCVPLLLLVLLLTLAAQKTFAQTRSPVPLPVPFTPVVDNANVIDAQTRQRLEAIYVNLKQRADIEFAVLTVPTTGDQDIFDFSLAVARGWGIGSKGGEKNGFLLVVAIQDRKYFTQVSDHLEADLTDGIVGQIQRERLVPQFRKGNYSQGIFDTIQAYVATLAVKRGFSIEGIDKSYAYREQPENRRSNGTSGSTVCSTIVVIIVILILLFVSSRRGGGGCLQALLLGSLFSNMGSGRGGSSGSGWSGGVSAEDLGEGVVLVAAAPVGAGRCPANFGLNSG